MPSRKAIVGSPGTGKTTRLLKLIEDYIKAGVSPEKIALVTFTKKAADEAATRAMSKFGLSRNDLPYFRTIHSLCFLELGLGRGDVLSRKHYDEIGRLLGLTLSGDVYEDASKPGDKCMFIDHYARTCCLSLEEAYAQLNIDVPWFQLKQFSDTLTQYKMDTGLTDFTDMLEQFQGPSPVKVAIIDEAQDLSLLQWKVIHKAFGNTDDIIIAGDDDQAIYRWSGANLDAFIDFTDNIEVLNQSHRLPLAIYSFANSLVGRVGRRIPKTWQPRATGGSIQFHGQPDGLDLREGSWLLLARNIYLLDTWEGIARAQGVPYARLGKPAINPDHIQAIKGWEDIRKGKPVNKAIFTLVKDALKLKGKVPMKEAYGLADLKTKEEGIWHDALKGIPLEDREYYLAVLRRGEKITQAPRVNIGTIHSVKGGEADHVAILPDMAKRTYEHYQQEPDDEHRVFYVASTRSKQSLHLISPQSRYYYDF